MRDVSEKLERLLRDWSRRKRGARFVLQSRFDPNDFGYVGDVVSLVEIRPAGRFFYRSHGARMAELLGIDLTGRFVDEAPDKTWVSLAKQQFEQVLASGVPTVVRYYNEPVGRARWIVERLVLPL